MQIDKVLIAGGGIGGLTAAACLLEAGIDVEVYEQAPQLGEIGAGIQISANAGRVLHALGLGPALADVAARPEFYRFRLYDTGEVLQEIPLGAQYVARHGVPYYTLHRADLLRLIAERVQALKADAVQLDATAAGFSEDEHGAELRLADGSRVSGGAVVGADGIKSVIRPQIVGSTPILYTGDAAWRVTVPAEALAPELRPDTVDIWVGPARHAVVYPLRQGTLINFVGAVEDPDWREDSWMTQRPWEEMRSDFSDWNREIIAILDAADRSRCYKWALNNRAPVSNWSTPRATLIGDAAHPTLPYMAQGAAMAIEDAAVLARALDAAPDLPAAFALYQNNRIPRTTQIVNESSANRKLFHLPTIEALRSAFAARDMNAERTAWLFSYDPTRVRLK